MLVYNNNHRNIQYMQVEVERQYKFNNQWVNSSRLHKVVYRFYKFGLKFLHNNPLYMDLRIDLNHSKKILYHIKCNLKNYSLSNSDTPTHSFSKGLLIILLLAIGIHSMLIMNTSSNQKLVWYNHKVYLHQRLIMLIKKLLYHLFVHLNVVQNQCHWSMYLDHKLNQIFLDQYPLKYQKRIFYQNRHLFLLK